MPAVQLAKCHLCGSGEYILSPDGGGVGGAVDAPWEARVAASALTGGGPQKPRRGRAVRDLDHRRGAPDPRRGCSSETSGVVVLRATRDAASSRGRLSNFERRFMPTVVADQALAQPPEQPGRTLLDLRETTRDHERPVVRPQGQQDRCGGARRPDGRACERRGGIADPREPIEVTHFAHAPRIARACADLRCTRPSVHRPSPWPSPAATPAVTGALVPVARSPSWLSAPHLPPCPPLRPPPHLPPCPSLTRRDVGTPLLHFDPQTGPPWSARCSAGWRPPPTRSVPGGTWRPWRASAGSPISGALCARPPSCGRSEVRDRDG